jgi:putative Mg2+ transporter-C (MgtC) family protein
MNDFFKSIDWSLELVMCGRVLFATFLGALVGIEREYHHKDAGIRTFAAVSLGACLFTLISSHVPGSDPTRIAANIVVGIGFLGGGLILHKADRTSGLTTAAILWGVAAIGTGVGFGMYVLPTFTALLMLSLLMFHHFISGESNKNTS